MRCSHQCGCNPSPEYSRLLIATVAEVMVSVVREPYACLDGVKSIILRRAGEGLDDTVAEAGRCSLQEILGTCVRISACVNVHVCTRDKMHAK